LKFTLGMGGSSWQQPWMHDLRQQQQQQQQLRSVTHVGGEWGSQHGDNTFSTAGLDVSKGRLQEE
jgi:hypothetical protein